MRRSCEGWSLGAIQVLKLPRLASAWMVAWLAAASALGGVLTARRNHDYRTAVALWADTTAKRPGNASAHGKPGFGSGEGTGTLE